MDGCLVLIDIEELAVCEGGAVFPLAADALVGVAAVDGVYDDTFCDCSLAGLSVVDLALCERFVASDENDLEVVADGAPLECFGCFLDDLSAVFGAAVCF